MLGVLAGLGTRVFAWMLRSAKQYTTTIPALVRVPVASTTLAGIYGHRAPRHAVRAGHDRPRLRHDRVGARPCAPARGSSFGARLTLLATSFAVGGGGVGGLFIPLVVTGALLGRIVGGAVNELDTTLFSVIGVAAFLGAGYRVPLAAIVFVAEVTGRPGFIVPGLIAAVVAELMMGNSSVTTYQRHTVAELDAET